MDKNTPRKTGILRFFEVVGRDLTGMFLANFLACLGFVPGICIVLFGFASGSLVVMAAGAVIGGAIAGPCLAGGVRHRPPGPAGTSPATGGPPTAGPSARTGKAASCPASSTA